jgi:ribonuclease HII
MARTRHFEDLPDFALENELGAEFGGPIAGIDEAGRGPWAGPVVAAAVILDPNTAPTGLDDSKRLSAAARASLYDEIMEAHQAGIGIADVARIDRDNILQATLWAMARALEGVGGSPAAALVDGNRAPKLACPCRTVIGGDHLSLSIAAASIIAKVTRDRLMEVLANDHPAYGWERNKGYGTKLHAEALAHHGVTPHHRRSFKPVAAALERTAA